VLPVPEGYDPVRQVLINSVVNYWLPAYGIQAAVVVLGLLAALAVLVSRARRRRRRLA
jgi:arylsulfatase/uncharacterized sulfatase